MANLQPKSVALELGRQGTKVKFYQRVDEGRMTNEKYPSANKGSFDTHLLRPMHAKHFGKTSISKRLNG